MYLNLNKREVNVNDTMEAVMRFNDKPIRQNLNYQQDGIVLLDPTDNSNENGSEITDEENELQNHSDFEEIDSEEADSEEIDSDDE
jgi:hypothetical protein